MMHQNNKSRNVHTSRRIENLNIDHSFYGTVINLCYTFVEIDALIFTVFDHINAEEDKSKYSFNLHKYRQETILRSS